MLSFRALPGPAWPFFCPATTHFLHCTLLDDVFTRSACRTAVPPPDCDSSPEVKVKHTTTNPSRYHQSPACLTARLLVCFFLPRLAHASAHFQVIVTETGCASFCVPLSLSRRVRFCLPWHHIDDTFPAQNASTRKATLVTGIVNKLPGATKLISRAACCSQLPVDLSPTTTGRHSRLSSVVSGNIRRLAHVHTVTVVRSRDRKRVAEAIVACLLLYTTFPALSGFAFSTK